MAQLIYDNFNGGQVEFNSNWTAAPASSQISVIAGGATIGGYWVSCTSGQSYRQYTKSYTINVNFIGCMLISSGSGTEYIYISSQSTVGGSVGETQYILNFDSTGKILLRMNNVLSQISSTAGVVPTDGSSFGLQVRLTWISNFVVSYIFTVNNVDVWSGTFDWTAYKGIITATDGFYRIYLLPTGSPVGGKAFALDNLEILDTASAVSSLTGLSYLSLANGCSGRTALPVTPVLGGGIYILDPNTRHDTFYNNAVTNTRVYKKIPDPSVTTHLIGDE